MTSAKPRYGRPHARLRAQWAPLVAAGGVMCARPNCGRLIAPYEPWDLGHVDGDPTRIAGPEHRRCNRATAGRDASRRTRARHRPAAAVGTPGNPRPWSRHWGDHGPEINCRDCNEKAAK